jgi:hypothetical protein
MNSIAQHGPGQEPERVAVDPLGEPVELRRQDVEAGVNCPGPSGGVTFPAIGART